MSKGVSTWVSTMTMRWCKGRFAVLGSNAEAPAGLRLVVGDGDGVADAVGLGEGEAEGELSADNGVTDGDGAGVAASKGTSDGA